MPRRFSFTKTDVNHACQLYERERIEPLTDNGLFRGGLYVILSATQNYGRHIAMYNEMLESGMNTPDAITSDKSGLRSAVSSATFPNRKQERVYGFAEWYPTSDLPPAILEDAQNGRDKEFILRDRLAKEVPGIGPKCASMLMRMCGYEHVVPLDIWALRFLKELGYQVTVPDYKTNGGARGEEYRRYERWISKIAEREGFTPAFYQAMVWAKFSEDARRREKRRRAA